ncbi:MAG TPA: NEW3 domain-containing protein [Thermoanaerobaculia bacterium]|nr:NEW3 domain-containing protein [Thermoanaerobaculia bacterium]
MSFEHAKAEYDRARSARDQGVVSDATFRAQETAYRAAELDYEQAVLVATGAQQHITVESAVKSRSADGKTYIAVTLSYRIAGQLPDDVGTLRESLARIDNVTVSLLSEAGVVVSLPYEAHLYDLRNGQTRVVKFVLLKDVDIVQIALRYNSRDEHSTVYLLRDAAGRQLVVTATQYSQDVEPGGQAVFNLAVERLDLRNSAFRILVTGLPPDVTYEFFDESGARVSQIGFSDEVSAVKLQLKVYLPKNVPEAWIDHAWRPNVVCLAPGESAPADVDKSAGRAQLEIVPRGRGKLGLQLANLFEEVRMGQPVSIRAKVFNQGTRPIHTIRLAADLPVEWKAQTQPSVIPVLNPGAETLLQLVVTPPSDTPVGEYEATLRPESTAFGKTLDTQEQVLRIHITPRVQNVATAGLLVVVVGLLGALGYMGVRLSRT